MFVNNKVESKQFGFGCWRWNPSRSIKRVPLIIDDESGVNLAWYREYVLSKLLNINLQQLIYSQTNFMYSLWVLKNTKYNLSIYLWYVTCILCTNSVFK